MLALLAALFLCMPAAQSDDFETKFMPGFEDMPIMPGFTPVTESVLIFDHPAGRVVEATATGNATVDDAINFYAQSLAALGWQQGDDGHYNRGRETLDIDITRSEGITRLRFHLSPL